MTIMIRTDMLLQTSLKPDRFSLCDLYSLKVSFSSQKQDKRAEVTSAGIWLV